MTFKRQRSQLPALVEGNFTKCEAWSMMVIVIVHPYLQDRRGTVQKTTCLPAAPGLPLMILTLTGIKKSKLPQYPFLLLV